MAKNIRWGIAGLGNIAQTFAEELKLVDNCKLTAVASRNMEKARVFGKQFQVVNAFGSYEELFAFEEVDVIYIATPHTSHASLSISAMNHGKHVLCEKPLSTNKEEVQRIIDTADTQGVFMMEALWSRFNPGILKALEHVKNGDIGQIKYLQADFAFYSLHKSEEGRLLNPELAGGSILDIGIYPIFLAYLFLGMPQDILATSNFYSTGVEIQTSMIFEYAAAQAVLYSGLNSRSEIKAQISGTEGSIYFDPPWYKTQGYTLEKNGEIEHFDCPTHGNGYIYEIEEVNFCIREAMRESPRWNHQNSRELIHIMDEVRSKGNVIFPFET